MDWSVITTQSALIGDIQMHLQRGFFSSFLFLLLLCSGVANAGVILEDDFESGSAKKFWTSMVDVTVAKLPEQTGRTGNAMRFLFKGVASDKDSWSEARFDLGRDYEQLSIEFDLFVPSNYQHRRPSDNTDNNKFFRIWRTTYDDVEKLGASTLGQNGGSLIGSDYRVQASWGQSTAVKSASGFIGSSDLGKWMTVKIDVRAATDSSLGTIKIYKNGKLHLEDNSIKNHIAGTQGYRYGYLLGWANSGFSVDTILYIDNVRFLNITDSRPKPPIPI